MELKVENVKVYHKKSLGIASASLSAKEGEIIGEDFNHVHETHDPSAHAETSALKMAG